MSNASEPARLLLVPLAGIALVSGGCDSGVTNPASQVRSIGLAGGDHQIRFPGAPLLTPIRVVALDDAGEPVSAPDVPVVWTVQLGGGSVVGSSATDPSGGASAEWTLGPELGSQLLSVQVGEAPPVEVTARAVRPGAITYAVPGPDGSRGVRVTNPDGSDAAVVTLEGGEWPDWNSDGSAIIYSKRTREETWQLFRVAAPEWKEEQLTNLSAPDARGLLHMMPSFSPDGSKIVYHVKTSAPECGDSTWTQIFVANADGSNPVQLTDGCGYAHSRARFSPSGDRIVYRSLQENTWTAQHLTFSIWVMDADGSHQKRLTGLDTHESDPVWAPDGSRIYFSRADEEIWSMRPDGSDARFLLAPAWSFFVIQGVSPDGGRLLVDAYDGDAWSVVTIDLETGDIHEVAENAFLSDWRRGGERAPLDAVRRRGRTPHPAPALRGGIRLRAVGLGELV